MKELLEQITDLEDTICTTKALAAGFAQRFTEGRPQDILLSVEISMEDYIYTYCAIMDNLRQARDKVKELAAACKKED